MIILFIFTLILEIGIFPGLFLSSATPEFFIPLIVIASVSKSRKAGMIIAIISGILLDLFYIKGLGIRTLLFLFIAYFLGTYNDNFSKHSIFVSILLTVVSSLFYMVVYFILISILTDGVGINVIVKSIFSLQIPFLIIYSLFTHFVFRMIEKRR